MASVVQVQFISARAQLISFSKGKNITQFVDITLIIDVLISLVIIIALWGNR